MRIHQTDVCLQRSPPETVSSSKTWFTHSDWFVLIFCFSERCKRPQLLHVKKLWAEKQFSWRSSDLQDDTRDFNASTFKGRFSLPVVFPPITPITPILHQPDSFQVHPLSTATSQKCATSITEQKIWPLLFFHWRTNKTVSYICIDVVPDHRWPVGRLRPAVGWTQDSGEQTQVWKEKHA